MKRIPATIAIIAMAAVGTLALTGAAHADSGEYAEAGDGASATCSVSTWAGPVHDDMAQIDCALTDTKGDSNPVYIDWWQDGYKKIRFENHDGKGHSTTHNDVRYNPDGSFGDVYWKVCVDVRPGQDKCSETIHYYVS